MIVFCISHGKAICQLFCLQPLSDWTKAENGDKPIFSQRLTVNTELGKTGVGRANRSLYLCFFKLAAASLFFFFFDFLFPCCNHLQHKQTYFFPSLQEKSLSDRLIDKIVDHPDFFHRYSPLYKTQGARTSDCWRAVNQKYFRRDSKRHQSGYKGCLCKSKLNQN